MTRKTAGQRRWEYGRHQRHDDDSSAVLSVEHSQGVFDNLALLVVRRAKPIERLFAVEIAGFRFSIEQSSQEFVGHCAILIDEDCENVRCEKARRRIEANSGRKRGMELLRDTL
jgi:hypothetical protein